MVVPDNAGLLGSAAFREVAFPPGSGVPAASLAFGQPADERGFHVMEAPTENPVETFTGLGATGVEIMLCHVGRTSLQAHPMIPLVQVSADASVAERYAGTSIGCSPSTTPRADSWRSLPSSSPTRPHGATFPGSGRAE